MSRNSVGDVYAKVINDVCDQSRQDFEEGGVELATLDLLKSEWQKKLSGLKVAQLPWDPTPLPTKEPTLPSNVKPQTLPSNGNVVNTSAPPLPSLPSIKSESSAYPSQPGLPQHYPIPSFPRGQPMTARDRAAMNLHQSYGERAGPQIAQLQSGQARVPMSQSVGQPAGFIKQEDAQSGLSGVQDYRTNATQPSQVPIKSSQTDGAGDGFDDWRAEYGQRKQLAAAHRAEGDRLIREHFLARQQELEAGGLMLPLDEHQVATRSLLRKVPPSARERRPVLSPSTPPVPSNLARAQGDGAGDDDDDLVGGDNNINNDDDDDEDAINSDLDDPDEAGANEENGENTDQVMLCTYDKVQRVKNKWKCTLKDGILRVDGTEYVFHKGQGEFEW